MARNRIGLRRLSARGRGGVSFPFVITSISPASVVAGSGAQPLNVIGTGFPPDGIVYVDGVAQATGYGGSALLTFTMAAPVVAVPGFKTIQVKTALLHSNSFSYPVTFPAASLASLSPVFAYLGEGAAATLATGTGFFSIGTNALLNGSLLGVSFAFATSTTGTVTVGTLQTTIAGVKDIQIVNPAPGGGTSVVRTFSVRYRTPAITSKSASLIPINSGNFDVTLTDAAGGYYAPSWPDGGSIGLVDDVPVATVWLSATQLKITVPAAVTAAPGVKVIKVSNPTIAGGGGLSAGSNITVSAPTTTALSFSTRVRGFDPYTVRVSGTNYTASELVRYRGVNLATTFVNATTLDGTITAAQLAVAGAGDVDVTTPTGYISNAQTFTVLPWDYPEIGATLRGFYPGSTLVADGTGRAIQWTEYATGVRNLQQPDAAKRPAIVASVPTLNGKQAAFFDAVRLDSLDEEQWLVATTTGLVTKLELNLWIVGSLLSSQQVSSAPTMLGDPGGFLAYGRVTSGGISALDESGTSTLVTAPFTWQAGQAINARIRKTGGSLYVRVNKGTEVSAVHGVNPAVFTPTTVLMGKNGPVSTGYTGFIGAFVACDSNVNHTHRAQVDNLLAFEFATSFGTVSGTLVPSLVAPATAVQFETPFEITVTVAGGAVTGDRINVDNFVLDTIVDSPTSLRGMLTAGSLFTSGIKGITVSNLAGIGPPIAFTVTPFIPGIGPNLTSVSPNACTRCDDPFTLDCVGTNFTASSVVYADGIALPSFPDTATHMTATVTDPVLFVSGNKAITIVDPAGTSGAQLLSVAAWTINSVPEITTWFEGDDVLVTGTAISQATDKTGHSRHAVQPTGTKQPALIAADANFLGQPSIDFDGTTDELVVTGVNVAPNILTSAAWYAFAVYRADAITTSSPATSPFANSTIMGLSASGFFGMSVRTGPLMYGFTNDGAVKTVQNASLLATTVQFAVYRKQTNALFLSINAGAEQTLAGIALSGMSTQNLSLGAGLGANWFNGQIACAGTCFATPSAANQTRIKNYTRIKFGWVP